MVRGIFFVLLLSLFFLSPSAFAGEDGKEMAAVAATENWLSLVDAGEYSASWDAAAGYLRGAIDRKSWDDTLMGVRTPLGALLSRKVADTSYKTSLPGAPDGEYVIVRFATSFANKKSAVETVTAMLEKDGEWRVCGYYIY